MANGVSKNPSFHTDFWAKLFLGALFSFYLSQMYMFEISIPHLTCSKKKSFFLIDVSQCVFL